MILRHFAPHEFRCPCGNCDLGFEDMDPVLLRRLDQAREVAGVSFVVNSSIRCPEHNRSVGGVDGSAHTTGHAVDIRSRTGALRFATLASMLKAGFQRVGIAETFVHADTDPTKPAEVAWLYD